MLLILPAVLGGQVPICAVGVFSSSKCYLLAVDVCEVVCQAVAHVLDCFM